MNMEINRPKYINSNKCIGCSMSGVWRAVGYNPKVVVIFHSPKACAHDHFAQVTAKQYAVAACVRQPPRQRFSSTQCRRQNTVDTSGP